jgi:hypothetical protein
MSTTPVAADSGLQKALEHIRALLIDGETLDAWATEIRPAAHRDESLWGAAYAAYYRDPWPLRIVIGITIWRHQVQPIRPASQEHADQNVSRRPILRSEHHLPPRTAPNLSVTLQTQKPSPRHSPPTRHQ